MQLNRQANSTARAKALIDKTKCLFSAISNAVKYSEPKGRFSMLEDYETELFYPTPPFARNFTSGTQRTGSTKSTAPTTTSSVFSRCTYQTATTVAGEGDEPYSGKDDGVGAAQEDMEVGVGAFGGEDESSPELSSEDEEEEGVFIRSKRVKPLQPVFATSFTRNPYAAFSSQPLYKASYIFPTAPALSTMSKGPRGTDL
ncbi:hypothetical protein FRC01_005404 [Tulasnella sp. 417]|nr:hypothetical protein FRC01_005404 [Tulasnella sp. 417]